MEDARRRMPVVEGPAELRRIGSLGFPAQELTGEQGLIAHFGRNSSLNIFFGRGRRVRLADGTEWRIKSVTSGPYIVPVIRSEAGMIATSGPLFAKRSYGINGRGYAYTLIPLGQPGWVRSVRWALQLHEEQICSFTQNSINTFQPVPVAAVVMAFTLITHGIPGEADLVPQRE